MKNIRSCKEQARILLDSEMSEFDHDPQGYCESFNWKPSVIKKAVKKKNDIAYTSEEVEQLGQILLDCTEDLMFDTIQTSKVSDFIVNCVAKHILS